MSVNKFRKMFQDIMILKYEKSVYRKKTKINLWKDAMDLEGKKYKTEFDLLAQKNTIHEKIFEGYFFRV